MRDILKVNSLPLLEKQDLEKMDLYAGFIPISSKVHYFHTFIRDVAQKPTQKVYSFFDYINSGVIQIVFWFNGGPGCTSMDGMFLENGPLRFDLIDKSNLKLKINQEGWWRDAGLVFVDQPPQTGYSLGSLETTLPPVIDYFIIFLEEFFSIYKEYTKPEIYLAGESYAGVWVPNFAAKMVEKSLPIKGILLVNPWIDPLYQYPAILKYSQEKNLLPGHWLDNAKVQTETCLKSMAPLVELNMYSQCERIIEMVLDASKDDGKFCINKYDYTLRDHGYTIDLCIIDLIVVKMKGVACHGLMESLN